MIPRHATGTLDRLRKGFPVICITGPRQSGKTTLAKAAFPEKPYLSLEDPDIVRLAKSDPRGLLENYRDGLIIDEAQAVPQIFPYIKTDVDKDPRPGKYIITGSQHFNLLAAITESLAGRAAFLKLLPFSISELKETGKLHCNPFETIVQGLYPPLYDRDLTPYDWYTNYIASHVERDVRSILNVKDLGQFQTFVKMCAARVGGILNLSALALDCGITHNTAKAWISVLEASGIIYLLKPYHENFGKRLVKSPKLYFIDTGLAARLLGIKTAQDCFIHPNRGNLFESLIVSELIKSRANKGMEPDIYFWRNNLEAEVDIVYQDSQHLKAIEIKSSKTFSPDFINGMELWMRYSGSSSEDCSIIYAGDRAVSWKNISLIPWNSIADI
jgi:predicted AAA+ superfamily ATPase